MTAADSAERAQQHYDPREVQEKWLARWAGMDLFRASDDPADDRPRTYLLDMFPYPSGDLHFFNRHGSLMPAAGPLSAPGSPPLDDIDDLDLSLCRWNGDPIDVDAITDGLIVAGLRA